MIPENVFRDMSGKYKFNTYNDQRNKDLSCSTLIIHSEDGGGVRD